MDRLLRAAQIGSAADDHPAAAVTLPEGAVIEIVSAEQVAPYHVQLLFSDDRRRVVDFEPFLQRSRNPLIRAYLDPERFACFRVEQGDLAWGDYDLCFPIVDLYEGRI